MKTIKTTSSTTWIKMFEIPCDTSSVDSIVSAMKDYTDFFDGISDEEIISDYIDGQWGDVCSDGIVIWGDM